MKDDKAIGNNKIKRPFSILIPIYNEEQILEKSVMEIITGLNRVNTEYEIYLCENGSTDKTVDIAKRLHHKNNNINYFSLGHPNYGKALQKGINTARYEDIVVFEIDYYDLDFLRNSLSLLNEYDFIVGSKRAKGSVDQRPWKRRMITLLFNLALKILVGFKGTDTHGLKAMKKTKLRTVANSCRILNNLFSTELVIRAERNGLKVKEIPAHVKEIRQTRVSVLARIPQAALNLLKLFWVIRFKK